MLETVRPRLALSPETVPEQVRASVA